MNLAICLEKKAEAKNRLFCLPYAGGLGSAIYKPWATLLPSCTEIYSLEYPGRPQIGGTIQTELTSLIDILYNSIKDLLNLPYVIYGHSLGSFMAYELVKRIQNENQNLPRHLVATSRRAPHIPYRGFSLRNLDDDTFIDIIHKKYNAIPSALMKETELLKIYMPILRSDMDFNEQHSVYQDLKINCPITLGYGNEEEFHFDTELKPWGELTDDPFNIITYSGDHFFMNGQSNRAKLIKLILTFYNDVYA